MNQCYHGLPIVKIDENIMEILAEVSRTRFYSYSIFFYSRIFNFSLGSFLLVISSLKHSNLLHCSTDNLVG